MKKALEPLVRLKITDCISGYFRYRTTPAQDAPGAARGVLLCRSAGVGRRLKQLVPDPEVRRMFAVLDLEPVIAPAGAIAMIEPLRNNALEVHVAGDLEQDITDLALLVFSGERCRRSA